MFVRKSLVGLVTVSMTGAVLALTVGAAQADPDDTVATPVEADIVGVGSDTSQNALFRLANAYNAKNPAPSAKLVSFAATGGGQITLHNGPINRPNGSGAGKGLLYGAGNNVGVDFARSSSALSTAEVGANLRAFPFALDTLGTAVSGSVASNAPASLTRAQLLSIYKGDVTNWSQLGGQPGTIVPLIPQDGSGTRSFFIAQLTAENGGTAPQLGTAVQTFQENDDASIKSNPNAVAPFSTGRAALLGSTLRVEQGFAAKRALYNVVRNADLGNASIQAIFGEDGYLCSTAARAEIVSAGFEQLATPADDGVCGSATQAATSNFTVSEALPDDTTFAPDAADVVGVGSDTSQNALFRLATSYNDVRTAGSPRLATFAATGGGQIPLHNGPINRPNGSGAGKGLLYGAGNNVGVDFARSSSALSTAEVGANLRAFPFALDTLGTAVSGSVASNAPASLTRAQLLSIYKGDVTNWSQLGGQPGTIVPLIPQDGSGTRSFFIAQLTAENGGTAPQLGTAVQTFQENDDASIKSNPNAVAPFSTGRAALLGSTLRVEQGFAAKRALYNVVRNADLGNASIQAIFGEDGYLCSDDARDEIIAAGFEQLATPADDGVCGSATQAATSNFTVNNGPDIATTTTLAATSPSPRTLHLVATVAGGSGTPTGSVTFTAGGNTLGTAAVTGGTATLDLTDVAAGSYTVTAAYTPTEGTAYTASTGTATVTVADNPAVATTTSLAATSTTPRTLHLVATVSAASGTPTGSVTFTAGGNTLGTADVSGGTATLDLTGVAPGSYTVTATFVPSGTTYAGSTGTASVTVADNPVATTTALAGTNPSAKVVQLVATVSGGSSAPAGRVTFRSGSTVLGTVTVASNRTATLKKTVAPGLASFTATFVPTAGTNVTGSVSPARSVRIKTSSSISESFATTVSSRASSAKGTVTVVFSGLSTKPTGKVAIREGSKLVGSGTLSSTGKVSVTLSKSKVGTGKSKLTISYAGNSYGFGSTRSFYITFNK